MGTIHSVISTCKLYAKNTLQNFSIIANLCDIEEVGENCISRLFNATNSSQMDLF